MVESVSVRSPQHLLDGILRHERFHRAHHPLHEEWDVHKVLVADGLWVVLLEEIDDLARRRLDLGRLTEKADALVVVYLDGLVWVKPRAIVRDLRSSILKVQMAKRELHQSHSPAYETVAVSACGKLSMPFLTKNLRICVAECLLRVLGRRTVDVENDHVFPID